MRKLSINKIDFNIYNIEDFPYGKFDGRTTVSKGSRSYVDMLGAYDIESTTISKHTYPLIKRDFAFMYIWQMCLDGELVVGRTWEEYIEFIRILEKILDLKYRKLVLYVHNLSYEFQFIKDFFTWEKVFAKDKRKVVYAQTNSIEYRCSYMLTNMGLAKFLEKQRGVTIGKLDGKKFNYRKERYQDTELTDYEMLYSVIDVYGLWQGITNKLKDDGDDLFTVPMTSTGYVRRDYREKCINNREHMNRFLRTKLTPNDYLMCKEVLRGGISGSNHMHTNETLEELQSFDIKSSYPYQMLTKYFPNSKFSEYIVKFGSEKMWKLLDSSCCIILWTCKEIHLKRFTGIPYISKSKCKYISTGKDTIVGNGKVYRAKQIMMYSTEIDFKIIDSLYEYKEPVIVKFVASERGMLSHAFRSYLREMFQFKTDLEEGDPYDYAKYKNKINASFGMMLTDILNPLIEFKPLCNEPWKKHELTDLYKALKEYYSNRNHFLSYQDGVWVTSHARDDLNVGMQIMKNDLVQVDTDSVKGLCDIHDYRDEFDKINKEIMKRAETYDIKPYAFKGDEKVYLGIWEYDAYYKEFKTLGAKKYCYRDGKDKFKITVAGLSKSSNEWIEEHGAFDFFSTGNVVPPGISGRTSGLYNDLEMPKYSSFNGHTFYTGSNIAINDVEYTFAMTHEWMQLVLDDRISVNVDLSGDGAWQ